MSVPTARTAASARYARCASLESFHFQVSTGARCVLIWAASVSVTARQAAVLLWALLWAPRPRAPGLQDSNQLLRRMLSIAQEDAQFAHYTR